MERDTASIIDTYSIALLKKERIGGPVHEKYHEHYQEGVKELRKKYPDIDWDQIIDHLYKINSYIWDLEAEIRQGMLDRDHVEIGKRSIMIRKINSLRTGFGNIINRLVGENFQNIKQDHISE